MGFTLARSISPKPFTRTTLVWTLRPVHFAQPQVRVNKKGLGYVCWVAIMIGPRDGI
jgi:hypothetical protein